MIFHGFDIDYSQVAGKQYVAKITFRRIWQQSWNEYSVSEHI